MKAPILFFAKRNAFAISSTFVMTAILIAGNAVFAYQNLRLRRSIDNLRNQVQPQKLQLETQNKSHDGTSETEQFLSGWDRSRITFKSIPPFMTGLADHASQSGLQVIKITPEKWSVTGWLMSCPFETEFRGKADQFLTFLSQLDRAENAIVVNAITVERATENSSDLRLRIKFTAYGEKSE